MCVLVQVYLLHVCKRTNCVYFSSLEDLSEFGIAPKAIVTTDDFASKTKDRIREKARQLAAAAAPIPGATLLDDLITPAK